MIAERLNEKCWKNLKTLEAAGVLDVKIEEFVHFNQLKMSSLHGMIDIIHLENYFKQDYTKHNKNFSMIYPVGSPYSRTQRERGKCITCWRILASSYSLNTILTVLI
ncbi:hypothetical protein CRE_17014 [Caenorhabditis remanei]|uniref:DUF38 domain-containing protein n=1 Tax=Caenorhabditis remanei TaxID=31234 RepID=E3N7Y8_CAERE|nr:hypothetical protein CRE_17014 [Caenorhabditis remanei]